MGILNFWLYDEEVFELEQGRLLFRGANGSGKSVTMQSFIPLVLMETSARSAWIRLVQGIAAWNIIFWATARLAIWIELAISGLNFITKINRAIKPSELPCAPEEGRRKWFLGIFAGRWTTDQSRSPFI